MPWISIDRILEAEEAEAEERWPCRYCAVVCPDRGLLGIHTEDVHGTPTGKRGGTPRLFIVPREEDG